MIPSRAKKCYDNDELPLYRRKKKFSFKQGTESNQGYKKIA